MNKKYGLFLILGLIVGVDFGILLMPSLGNSPLVIGLGALGNVLFIVWFIAAILSQRSKDKVNINDQ